MQKIVEETATACLIRQSGYNHGTTEQVTWLVKYKPNNLIVAETPTKKQALEWFAIVNNTKER